MTNVQESPDGYKWYVGGPETDDHLVLGGHEPALYPILRSMCDSTKGYVNVGAHVGTWAIRMAKHARFVIAFEANPLTAVALSRNVELNGIKNLRVVPEAVWNVDNERVSLIDVNDKPTGGSTRVTTDSEDGKVKTIKLDTAFEPVYNTVGLISMDVEGAEAKVLEGARDLIMAGRPNLLIELHEGHPGTDPNLREQVYGLLNLYNYTYTSTKACPPEEHLICYPAENTLVLDDPKPA